MHFLNSTPLWTAVITPLLKDGDVDYQSLKNILDQQEQANNAILILGSTGEALNLDDDEAIEILKFTIDQKKKVPLMCGVGGVNLKSTKKWIETLNTLAIDAYLLVTPLYAKPGDEGQYEWFKELMDLSNRPVMLYNVPSRTGISLSLKAVNKLKDHKNLWAIKEASGSVEMFEKYINASCGARLYSGDDALLSDFCEYGCSGLVSVAANVWPKETHKYVELCLDKNLKEKEIWQEATNLLFVSSNPIPVKWLMEKKDMIKTSNLRAPLNNKDMCREEEILEADGKITNWFEKP